ncbi:MAG TPA: cell division protein SepF [Actinomycetes bacterium]|nr:cell division protein SepF [Actinomycetes bacterium]
MAGAMRKMAVYLGLVEHDDRYGEYDEYADEASPGRADGRYDARIDDRVDERTRPLQAVRDGDRIEDLPPARPQRVASNGPESDYRITTLHPRTYNDARAIGEAFRDGTPVIMNLTEMDDTDAKRIVDFSAGLVFGRRGTIERVTQKVFLLSPANVVVTAEEKQRMAQGGFFNQS